MKSGLKNKQYKNDLPPRFVKISGVSSKLQNG
jgi:hypothetical protein